MRYILSLIAMALLVGCSSGPAPMIPPLPPAEKAPKAAVETTGEQGDGMDDSGFGEDPLAGADMLDDVEAIEETPEKADEESKESEESKDSAEGTDTNAKPPAETPKDPEKPQ